jgi:hypothetical protein
MQFGEERSDVGGLVIERDDHREFGRWRSWLRYEFHGGNPGFVGETGGGKLSGGGVQRDVRISSPHLGSPAQACKSSISA